MKLPFPSPASLPTRLRYFTFVCGVLWSSAAGGHADTASVVAAANTLIATSTASGASPTVQTSTYTLAIAKQWTNLPGGTRNGSTIGGGPAALSTDLSATVPAASRSLPARRPSRWRKRPSVTSATTR